MSMHALPTEIHWTTEKGTWKVLEISRPHIQNFKTTVPIFKTTKCGQDTAIGLVYFSFWSHIISRFVDFFYKSVTSFPNLEISNLRTQSYYRFSLFFILVAYYSLVSYFF